MYTQRQGQNTERSAARPMLSSQCATLVPLDLLRLLPKLESTLLILSTSSGRRSDLDTDLDGICFMVFFDLIPYGTQNHETVTRFDSVDVTIKVRTQYYIFQIN